MKNNPFINLDIFKFNKVKSLYPYGNKLENSYKKLKNFSKAKLKTEAMINQLIAEIDN